MRILQYVLGLLLLIFLSNCSMIEYRNYEELNKHPGNEKYEIAPVLDQNYKIRETLLDSVKNQLIVNTKTTPIKEENTEYRRLKVSLEGEITDEGPIYTLLKDGTLWYTDHYNNWVINGNTTKHKYIDPMTKEQKKDMDKWLPKFKELYNEASYVYLFSSDYFFKVNEKWYVVADTLEESPLNFRKLFPPKENQDVRMIELEDRTPDFSRGPTQRDTTLWTYHGYEEADSEEGVGLNPINFSAGWHYLQLKMPGSEPLKIARYGSMGVNMHTYIIPDSLGGREDVVYIVQEPSDLYPGREHGGMYVVRPRELGEESSQK